MVADAFHAVDCRQTLRLTIDCVIVPQNIDTSALMSTAVSLVETACENIVSRDKLVGGSVAPTQRCRQILYTYCKFAYKKQQKWLIDVQRLAVQSTVKNY